MTRTDILNARKGKPAKPLSLDELMACLSPTSQVKLLEMLDFIFIQALGDALDCDAISIIEARNYLDQYAGRVGQA